MTYAEKLRDPRWQRKRLQILERDNFTCIICKIPGRHVQCHHILYAKKDPWDYPDYLLQTLCEECHEERQELTDKISNAVRIAIAKTRTEKLVIVAEKICADAMLAIEVQK